MKKNVFDINDLQNLYPFFKTHVGTYLGKKLLNWLCIEKVNKVYGNNIHLRGADFTSGLLAEPAIDLKYKVIGAEKLKDLPKGSFITVSNHPIGSIDGVILIDLFARLRPDYKVMVNGVLEKIEAMSDNFISVIPDSKNTGPNRANVYGLRHSLQHIQEGHPVGFFPAGAMSFYNFKQRKIKDIAWRNVVIKLIRKTNVPVYPVYFDFLNSPLFYFLGTIDWRLRSLRVPAEVFNKQGRTVRICIGDPIYPEQIETYTTDVELAKFLEQSTYDTKYMKD